MSRGKLARRWAKFTYLHCLIFRSLCWLNRAEVREYFGVVWLRVRSLRLYFSGNQSFRARKNKCLEDFYLNIDVLTSPCVSFGFIFGCPLEEWPMAINNLTFAFIWFSRVCSLFNGAIFLSTPQNEHKFFKTYLHMLFSTFVRKISGMWPWNVCFWLSENHLERHGWYP